MSPERKRLVQKINQGLIECGGLCTIDDLIDLARDRRVQVFERGGSLTVTEILAYPQRTVCNVIIAAGDWRDIIATQPDVDKFARSEGADLLVAHGRPGWARIGAASGWLPQATRYFRTLPTNGSEP